MLSRATLNARPSSGQLLKRVLEVPDLPQRVQAMPAPLLGRLIERVGLADAGELVALATTEQLAEIFDQDLWQSPALGVDERFDAERFLLWLEVMAEAGDAFVAARLAELPPDLVTLAVHRHALVVSLSDLERELTGDDEAAFGAQKAFDSCLSEEIDDYQVIWRGGEGWDQLLNALLALDREHHGLLVDVLERCAAMSSEQLEDQGGLGDVLTSEQMLEDDLAGAREERRAEAGFVSPSAARAFLRLAAGRASNETPFTEHDPLTRAYFRRLGPLKPAVVGPLATGPLLPRPMTTSTEPLLLQALRRLADDNPTCFARRADELSYLANVLVAGAEVDGRRLRPIDAVELALQSVGAGLLLCCPKQGVAQAVLALQAHPCDGLFRLALLRSDDREVRHLAKTVKL